jgi:hypothetical protein
MKTISTGFALLAIGVACAILQVTPLVAEEKPDSVFQWEYRVLTKEQILDLGNKDLAGGLNKLGDEGWELVVVDAAYIFKRPKDQIRKQVAEIKRKITLMESDVESRKDRVAWAERMAKKGYMSNQRVEAERLRLKVAESALEEARTELKSFLLDPKESPGKDNKPEK